MRFLTAMCGLAAVVAVRGNAAEEPTVPEIIESLRRGDRKARSRALSEMTYDCVACRPVVPALIEVFREGDAELRKSALERLAEVGPVAEEAVPLLKEALRSARLLIAMPQQASKLVAPLIQLCEHEDPEARAVAAELLSRLPSPPVAVIERIRELIPDDSFYIAGGDFYGIGSGELYVGEQAAQALAQIGVRAVPALRRTLRDGSFRARCRAAGGLCSIGPDAKPATADLIDCLEDPTPGIRVAAAKALAQVANDDGRASKALIEALDDRRLDVRITAATALGAFPAQVGPVRALCGALTDDCLGVRIAAADSLGRLGPKAQTAVPSLEKLLQDEYPTGRNAAAKALKTIQADSSTSTGR